MTRQGANIIAFFKIRMLKASLLKEKIKYKYCKWSGIPLLGKSLTLELPNSYSKKYNHCKVQKYGCNYNPTTYPKTLILFTALIVNSTYSVLPPFWISSSIFVQKKDSKNNFASYLYNEPSYKSQTQRQAVSKFKVQFEKVNNPFNKK